MRADANADAEEDARESEMGLATGVPVECARGLFEVACKEEEEERDEARTPKYCDEAWEVTEEAREDWEGDKGAGEGEGEEDREFTADDAVEGAMEAE